MDLSQLWPALEALPVAAYMRESALGFPAVESIHVVALVLVVGSIAVVDLRLLNLTSPNVLISEIVRDTLKWTWIAFAVAVVSGFLMFAAKATEYVVNTPFRLKLICLALAGLNMLVFELITARRMADWDSGPTPMAVRVAGGLSLVFWIAVVAFGRWIGFAEPAY